MIRLWNRPVLSVFAAVILLIDGLQPLAAFQKTQPDEKTADGLKTGDSQSDQPSTAELIIYLSDPERADSAVKQIVARGRKAVPDLIIASAMKNDLAVRGWSILCLSRIGGRQADRHLLKLHANVQEPLLVRTWAAAARVQMANSPNELLKLSGLARQFPSLSSPIGNKLQFLIENKKQRVSLAQLLKITASTPELRESFSQTILARGPNPLVNMMKKSKDAGVRKEAVRQLEILAERKYKTVADRVIASYRFDPGSTEIPWSSGQLVVPELNWTQKDARLLVQSLISWHLWCEVNLPDDRRTRLRLQRPIEIALKSKNLASAAGYQAAAGSQKPVDWLLVWGRTVGKEDVERILREQNLDTNPRYKRLLNSL